MAISVVDPASPAINRTRKILFQPFDIGKWFTLGFCAWLAHLGEGGGGGGSGFQGGGGPGGGPGPDIEPVLDWIRENVALIVMVVLAVVVVAFLIGLLVTWLSSRGHFMFLDGVVRNRGAVREPWSEYRREGNSLFLFRVCFGLAAFGLFVLVATGAVAIAWPDIAAGQFGGSAVAALGLGILVFLMVAIAVGCVSLFLKDFIVPIMYLRRVSVMPAWREFYQFLLADHLGTFVLYVLFKIVIAMAIGIIAMLATCLTCCIAALPYIGTVILLPLFVFLRAYPLYFIEQFGPEWQIIPEEYPISDSGKGYPGSEYGRPPGKY
ncbi:MAG: DUF7544 domain-containing protein [Planctomycetota bacterium]|jgi:hypothetical protein